jgi:hypothetical protein
MKQLRHLSLSFSPGLVFLKALANSLQMPGQVSFLSDLVFLLEEACLLYEITSFH